MALPTGGGDQCPVAWAFLEPWQVGVGAKGGTEAVVHAWRRWAPSRRSDPHHVLAKLDMSDAFSSVKRQAILESVRGYMPAPIPWVDLDVRGAFESPAQWSCDQAPAWRPARGPSGPLFGLVAHHAWTGAPHPSRAGLDSAVFYLDEWIMAGPEAAVGLAVRALATELCIAVFALNPSKCSLTPSAGGDSAVTAAALPGWHANQCGGARILGAAGGGGNGGT